MSIHEPVALNAGTEADTKADTDTAAGADAGAGADVLCDDVFLGIYSILFPDFKL